MFSPRPSQAKTPAISDGGRGAFKPVLVGGNRFKYRHCVYANVYIVSSVPTVDRSRTAVFGEDRAAWKADTLKVGVNMLARRLPCPDTRYAKVPSISRSSARPLSSPDTAAKRQNKLGHCLPAPRTHTELWKQGNGGFISEPILSRHMVTSS